MGDASIDQERVQLDELTSEIAIGGNRCVLECLQPEKPDRARAQLMV